MAMTEDEQQKLKLIQHNLNQISSLLRNLRTAEEGDRGDLIQQVSHAVGRLVLDLVDLEDVSVEDIADLMDLDNRRN